MITTNVATTIIDGINFKSSCLDMSYLPLICRKASCRTFTAAGCVAATIVVMVLLHLVAEIPNLCDKVQQVALL